MSKKLKELWGRLYCKLDRHDFKKVPFEWRDEGPPGAPSAIKSGTNAECRRCGVREHMSWMTKEEAKAILRESFPELYRAQWGD